MRCLHALGEWDKLSDFVQSKWGSVGQADHRQMASLAAAAAWQLKQWDLMEDYVAVMKKDTPDYFFYRAVISIHGNQFAKAMKYIDKARVSVDPELHSLFSESYTRAYKCVCCRELVGLLVLTSCSPPACSSGSRCCPSSRRSSRTSGRPTSRTARRRCVRPG